MSRGAAIVNMVAATDASVRSFIAEGTTFPDANTSEGFGQICEGLIQLLNENIKPYDGGQLYAAIEVIANRVAWSLDESEIDYAREEG
jgi:hypothetical protein